MNQRLTILSLLCTLVAAANDVGPGIRSRFLGGRLKVGPKGAVVLLHGSRTQLNELHEGYEASRKLGLQATAAAGPGSGWIVLDTKSIVVAQYDRSYTFAAILVHQFNWAPPGPATEVEGKQLTAKAGASNATVAPGQRVALILDIDLDPSMHVYAPGVEGYIPIDWKMQDSPVAAVHDAIFPHSEKLYLKAIDETVPAYRNHFRLTRDITIRPPLDGSGEFTVPGSLRYQACDDRVCYIPQELHLTWTFKYVQP
jgi:Thiol:disulfide interchange protein DsbD, N-terminal